MEKQIEIIFAIDGVRMPLKPFTFPASKELKEILQSTDFEGDLPKAIIQILKDGIKEVEKSIPN